jgi:hypothetical protein
MFIGASAPAAPPRRPREPFRVSALIAQSLLRWFSGRPVAQHADLPEVHVVPGQTVIGRRRYRCSDPEAPARRPIDSNGPPDWGIVTRATQGKTMKRAKARTRGPKFPPQKVRILGPERANAPRSAESQRKHADVAETTEAPDASTPEKYREFALKHEYLFDGPFAELFEKLKALPGIKQGRITTAFQKMNYDLNLVRSFICIIDVIKLLVTSITSNG